MVVRYFNDGLGRFVTRLLDLPVYNLGTRRRTSSVRSILLSGTHLLNRLWLYCIRNLGATFQNGPFLEKQWAK